MKKFPINYVVQDMDGNVIARETGVMYQPESIADMESLFSDDSQTLPDDSEFDSLD